MTSNKFTEYGCGCGLEKTSSTYHTLFTCWGHSPKKKNGKFFSRSTELLLKTQENEK